MQTVGVRYSHRDQGFYVMGKGDEKYLALLNKARASGEVRKLKPSKIGKVKENVADELQRLREELEQLKAQNKALKAKRKG